MAIGTEPWRERLDLADYVPTYVRTVLHVGCGRGGVGRLLKSRGMDVHGVEPHPDKARRARAYLDSAIEGELGEAALPFAPGYFDWVILSLSQYSKHRARQVLQALEPVLAPTGMVMVLVPNPAHWKASREPRAVSDCTPADLEALAADLSFGVYIRKPIRDPLEQSAPAAEGGSVTIQGRRYESTSPAALQALFTIEYVVMLTRRNYNPIVHAHELFGQGRVYGCYEVLSLVPACYLTDAEVAARVAADKQLCLLELEQEAPRPQKLGLLFTGLAHFSDAVKATPDLHQAYQTQAESWRRIGDAAMGLRILRSVNQVAPSDSVAQQIAVLERLAQPSAPVDLPPVWSPPARLPRVLFITHERPNYGLDVLYDGLCTVLGDQNVVDYPWKPSLHGMLPQRFADYPCLFDREGVALSLDDVLTELHAGRFDLLLFGDIEQRVEASDARRILDAAESLPLCIVDMQDEPQNYLPMVLDHLERDQATAYFKREMLACWDYGPAAYPLPFAYADGRIPAQTDRSRSRDIFWAGHRDFGLRRLYLEAVEKQFNRTFDRRYNQAEYAEALLDSRIGLSFFGFGFDTVRYWEIPAHGGMLLSERLPIRVPANFENGASAVFFDDTNELLTKLEYFLGHPGEARAIAQAGRAHLKRFHSGSARARHLLGYIQAAQTSP